MAFIYEKVPEKDWAFFKSMGLKDCWGSRAKNLNEDTKWCADKERNAYLVEIGGGYKDMPNFCDFWWNGYVIRMEILEGGKGNYSVGVDIVWIINKIPIPESIWESKDAIVGMIKEAFETCSSWCPLEKLNSISVRINCEPEMVEGK